MKVALFKAKIIFPAGVKALDRLQGHLHVVRVREEERIVADHLIAGVAEDFDRLVVDVDDFLPGIDEDHSARAVFKHAAKEPFPLHERRLGLLAGGDVHHDAHDAGGLPRGVVKGGFIENEIARLAVGAHHRRFVGLVSWTLDERHVHFVIHLREVRRNPLPEFEDGFADDLLARESQNQLGERAVAVAVVAVAVLVERRAGDGVDECPQKHDILFKVLKRLFAVGDVDHHCDELAGRRTRRPDLEPLAERVGKKLEMPGSSRERDLAEDLNEVVIVAWERFADGAPDYAFIESRDVSERGIDVQKAVVDGSAPPIADDLAVCIPVNHVAEDHLKQGFVPLDGLLVVREPGVEHLEMDVARAQIDDLVDHLPVRTLPCGRHVGIVGRTMLPVSITGHSLTRWFDYNTEE